MLVDPSPRLTTVAATPTVEQLYRLAIHRAGAEHDVRAAKYLPNGRE